MNTQTVSELTELYKLLNNKPQDFEQEPEMKKRNINWGAAFFFGLTLVFILTVN
jgi:hypothetical protein